MKLLFENWRKYLTELDNFDLSTFKLKESLSPEIWTNETLKPEIAQKLMEITNDFWNGLNLKHVDIVDIIITGSIANYNWTKMSDIDLHILVNFADVDENIELVEAYFRNVRANWNRTHDIRIKGHEVEMYVQEASEPHVSTGVYSLFRDEWETTPAYQEVAIDEAQVVRKADCLMDLIDDVKEVYEAGKYVEAHEEAKRLMSKIRIFRRCGLEHGGEFSPENLAFKVLRRNGYLGKLVDIRSNSYDYMMSLNGGQPSDIMIRVDEKKNPRIPRKKGQPAKSKKHSDLYTDEDPKGTIHGLKFATVKDAKASVTKIKKSGRSHAHKIQAAVAMEQRAKAAKKKSAAAVYRKYINSIKKDK